MSNQINDLEQQNQQNQQLQQNQQQNQQEKQGGFTLIELLAVITIMGILMLVAIPAISRTIENSRRNTFANTAQQYISAVKTAVAADEIECGESSTKAVASALAPGCYYYPLNTKQGATEQTGTTDLLEQGGKSSFGKADVNGYVAIYKSSATTKTNYYYGIYLMDSAGNGINQLTAEEDIKRAAVSTGGTPSTITKPENGLEFHKTSCNWKVCSLSS